MCGVVGFFTQKHFESFHRSLPGATASLAHRGPDDFGIYADASAGVGLGHRRLSILDLSPSGHQPMASDDSKVSIVFNGEVYNFKVLRKELEKAGHQFRSDSDTEVILKAYLEWGTACLGRFIGMFALAIWDGRSRRLFLARDQMGIKPLYYYYHDGSLIFASELKGILAFREIPKALDTGAVSLFLHYQYIPSPRTIYQHIFKLLPGHFLICDSETFSIRPWAETPNASSRRPSFPSGISGGESACLDQLQEILTRVISDQMVSDVPLGALLSGGIDSSLVAAIMQQVGSRPVRTFSIGFGESEFNEAPWAARVASCLGTSHTELYVTSKDALSAIPRLPEIYDEPFADASAIPSFLVSQLTRSHVTVALSGDGGDEQFCGYTRYWATRAMASGFQRLPESLRAWLYKTLSRVPAAFAGNLYNRLQFVLPSAFRSANFPDKWQKLIAQMNHADLQSLYRISVCLWDRERIERLTGRFPESSRFEQAFDRTMDWPDLSRLMWVDQQTYLTDAMLVKVDRASMAAGLEIRVPLLDQRVVEFASKIPEDFLFQGGKGKHILRGLLSRYIPAALFERPKMGFAIPVSRWLRGELKPMLLDYLDEGRLKREGLFDTSLVAATVSDHLSGRANHPHRLWALLMWEMWREKWL
ncbi:MAG: asparagine synthase (glutamine-hydrolyzing) [Deltaproteobacteria bacterium]|nr:asparagine synthase (glutamine-hydrolyzing) [Deltaproteobacteria bacterium]